MNKIEEIKIPQVKSRITLRDKTSDLRVFDQVFIFKHYGINFPLNPKVIIDGGANIGLFTLFIKNEFPESIVICIEPDEDNYKILFKNVASYKSVFCENSGLWDKETKLYITDKYGVGKWGMCVVEDEKQGTVNAVSIDYLVNKYSIDRIDILKLDIETSEKIIFSRNYINWLKKTKMIVIELHDFFLDGCAKTFFNAINEVFESYSYEIYGENTIIINNDI